jgi:hypothetical protein
MLNLASIFCLESEIPVDLFCGTVIESRTIRTIRVQIETGASVAWNS